MICMHIRIIYERAYATYVPNNRSYCFLGRLASRKGPPLISELCSIHEFDNILKLKFDPDKYKSCELTNKKDIFPYEHLFVRRYTIRSEQEVPYPWFHTPRPYDYYDNDVYVFVAAVTPEDLLPDTPDNAAQVITKHGNKIGASMCDDSNIYYAVTTSIRIASGDGMNIYPNHCGIPTLLAYLCLIDSTVQGQGQGYDFEHELSDAINPKHYETLRQLIPRMTNYFSKIIHTNVNYVHEHAFGSEYHEVHFLAVVNAAKFANFDVLVTYDENRAVWEKAAPVVVQLHKIAKCLHGNDVTKTFEYFTQEHGFLWFLLRRK